MASPSTVLTLGIGGGSTASELLRLGFGIGEATPDPPRQFLKSITIINGLVQDQIATDGFDTLVVADLPDLSTVAVTSINGAEGDITIDASFIASFAVTSVNGSVGDVTVSAGGGALFTHQTDVAGSAGVETDLYSDTIAANTLSANGDSLEANYTVISVAAGTTLRVYFAATKIFDSGFFGGVGSTPYRVDVTVQRDSSSTVRCDACARGIAGQPTYTAISALDFTTTNILKATGQGTAGGDITAKRGRVQKIAAP